MASDFFDLRPLRATKRTRSYCTSLRRLFSCMTWRIHWTQCLRKRIRVLHTQPSRTIRNILFLLTVNFLRKWRKFYVDVSNQKKVRYAIVYFPVKSGEYTKWHLQTPYCPVRPRQSKLDHTLRTKKILGQSQNGPYFGINRKNDHLRKRSEFQTLLLAGNRASNECLANVDRFNQQQIHHWLHLCANNEVTLHVHIQIAVNQQASYDLHRQFVRIGKSFREWYAGQSARCRQVTVSCCGC